MVPNSIISLYTAEIVEDDGSYYVEIPSGEVENTHLQVGDTVKVGLHNVESESNEVYTEPVEDNNDTQRFTSKQHQTPPVAEDDEVTVTVEDVGKKGDGIARVDGSFVIIVPGARPGDTVDVKVTDVKETFAIGEPVEFKQSPSVRQ